MSYSNNNQDAINKTVELDTEDIISEDILDKSIRNVLDNPTVTPPPIPKKNIERKNLSPRNIIEKLIQIGWSNVEVLIKLDGLEDPNISVTGTLTVGKRIFNVKITINEEKSYIDIEYSFLPSTKATLPISEAARGGRGNEDVEKINGLRETLAGNIILFRDELSEQSDISLTDKTNLTLSFDLLGGKIDWNAKTSSSKASVGSFSTAYSAQYILSIMRNKDCDDFLFDALEDIGEETIERLGILFIILYRVFTRLIKESLLETCLKDSPEFAELVNSKRMISKLLVRQAKTGEFFEILVLLPRDSS